MHITIWKVDEQNHNHGELAYFYAEVCPPYMEGQDFYMDKKYTIKKVIHALIRDSKGHVLDSKLELYVMESE